MIAYAWDMPERPSLPATALAGLATFVGLVALQHATRAGDLPPADHFVSEYAVGDGGWVQAVAFLAWAGGLAATAVLMARRARARPIGRALAVLGLAAGAVGALTCAFFATQTVGGELPPGVARTTAGRLHDLGSAAIFFGLLVAAVAGARVIRRRRYRLGILGLAALLVLAPAVLVAAGYDAPGWGQRAFIAIGCGWQWLAVSELGRLDE
jgi:MFS family permease